MRNPLVDNYLKVGCGRCSLVGTPDCKAVQRREELVALREIVLECGLTEELKWSFPTYTYRGKNVLMVSAFKEYSSINFFAGALIPDPQQHLERPGPNTQAARLLKFANLHEVLEKKELARQYVLASLEVERSGARREAKFEAEYELPDELAERLASDESLAEAFNALTPGRQRSYVIFIGGAKQSATRAARVEKCVPKILAGLGFHD